MANETIGRVTCAVCGEQSQDLRINKNYNLYCYCDNGCKWQLNKKNSKSALAALRSGRSIALEKIGIIRPVTDDPAPVIDISKRRQRDTLEEELDI